MNLQGQCQRGDKCHYNHDPQVLKETAHEIQTRLNDSPYNEFSRTPSRTTITKPEVSYINRQRYPYPAGPQHPPYPAGPQHSPYPVGPQHSPKPSGPLYAMQDTPDPASTTVNPAWLPPGRATDIPVPHGKPDLQLTSSRIAVYPHLFLLQHPTLRPLISTASLQGYIEFPPFKFPILSILPDSGASTQSYMSKAYAEDIMKQLWNLR